MAEQKSKNLLDRILLGFLWLVVLFDTGLGAQMLIMPMGWYEGTPGVSETGPFNSHFVRDVGIAYLTAAAALALGLLKPAFRTPLFLIAFLFFGGHALMHAVEMLHGHAHEGTIGEIIAIIIPAIVLLIMLIRTKKRTGEAS